MLRVGRWFASGLLVVGLLLAAGAAVAQNPAAVLFPFVTTETGKFTFIALRNTGSSTSGTPITAYHFTYAMKPVLTSSPVGAHPVENKAGCEHFDGDVLTTPADLMIFEAGRKVVDPSGTTALFEGGTTAPVTSAPLAFPTAGRAGFLIVETNTPVVDSIFGTETVIDSAAGLAVSMSTAFLSSTIPTNPDFSGIDGSTVLPPPIGPTGYKNVSWFPTNIAETSWFVIPLGGRAAMAPSGGGGLRVGLTPRSPVLPTPGLGGAYDLDEHFFSGSKITPVRCFGYINRNDILQPGTDAAVAGGGWMAVASSPLTLAASDPVDPSGSYLNQPFMMIAGQESAALGTPKMTVHREPDLTPCFSGSGFSVGCGGGP